MPELGQTAQDRVTGFKGVVTGKVQYINGCAQARLTPSVNEDGSLPDSMWFDEQRLSVLSSDKIEIDNSQANGPDKPAPRR